MKNILTFILAIFLVTQLSAQQSEIGIVTNKLFIKNANVITKPGQAAIQNHILVEDGLIVQVGSNLTAPFDAEVIEADSMYIYPGFIAGLSHVAVPSKEENKDRPKVSDPGNPPKDMAGITPERQLRSIANHKDKSIADMRKQGFTISHSVPKGRMLPGKGSILLLSGDSYDDMLLREDVSLYATLKSANNVYPATVLAVMSKHRELFRRAKFAKQHASTFKRAPKGVKRPNYDNSVSSLIPVLDKTLPVFFSAEKALDIQRVMRLQNEIGFTLVTSEIKQGWHSLAQLKKLNSPVMLSLDLPKEIKEEKKKDEDDKEELAETKALKAKKKQAYTEYLNQAKLFSDQNINYAFSFINVKAKDVQTNMRRLVESGLSETKALEAVTTNPAKVLGISDIAGSIESGKLANLMVTTKPYFDKDAKIKYVFVEGHKYEYDTAKKKKKKSGDSSTDLSGTYSFTVEIPGMTTEGTLIINKDGEDYSGIISTPQSTEPSDIEDINQDGNNLNFTFVADGDGGEMNISMDIEFDGDTFEGDVTAGDFGTFPVTGQKKDPK